MKMLETIHFCIIVFVLAACVPKSTSLQKPPLAPVSGQATQTIGLLWWPADPFKTFYPFADDIDECLTDILADKCPEFELMHQQEIRDSLFPLMEPGTQPTSEESFAALLTREDVRKRLTVKGLRYLVAFAGGTSRDDRGFIFCGGGYGGAGCLGFAWIDKDTRIDAVIWELEGQERVEHLEGSAKGKTLIPAFILPIPIPAPTISKACEGLGQRIVEYIRLCSDNAECRGKR
jgi:hypothetical protein